MARPEAARGAQPKASTERERTRRSEPLQAAGQELCVEQEAGPRAEPTAAGSWTKGDAFPTRQRRHRRHELDNVQLTHAAAAALERLAWPGEEGRARAGRGHGRAPGADLQLVDELQLHAGTTWCAAAAGADLTHVDQLASCELWRARLV